MIAANAPDDDRIELHIEVWKTSVSCREHYVGPVGSSQSHGPTHIYKVSI